MAEECYPREIPMVRSYLKILPTVEKELKTVRCQMKAIIKYHETCANAAKKLADEFDKCKK
jgi:hypothetical protein